MGRIRTIKPEFYTDEDLSKLSVEAHHLAGGLLTYADDFGFFNANPGLIKAAIFPLRDTSLTVLELLRKLQEVGFIQLGTGSDGKRWGKVVKFSTHQRVSHPTPSKISSLSIDWENSGNSPEDSGNAPDGSNIAPEPFLPEGKGKEGNGRELNVGAREEFNEFELAQGVIVQMQIPGNKFLMDSIARAIVCIADKSGNPKQAAAEWLIGQLLMYQQLESKRWGLNSFIAEGHYDDDPNTWSKGNANSDKSPAQKRAERISDTSDRVGAVLQQRIEEIAAADPTRVDRGGAVDLGGGAYLLPDRSGRGRA